MSFRKTGKSGNFSFNQGGRGRPIPTSLFRLCGLILTALTARGKNGKIRTNIPNWGWGWGGRPLSIKGSLKNCKIWDFGYQSLSTISINLYPIKEEMTMLMTNLVIKRTESKSSKNPPMIVKAEHPSSFPSQPPPRLPSEDGPCHFYNHTFLPIQDQTLRREPCNNAQISIFEQNPLN